MAKLRRVRRGRNPKRDSYDRVLIVTEGTRTEPFYFEGLLSHHRLNTANVEVSPSTLGSDPDSIVETATRIRAEEARFGDPYERVYCVFDRNSHTNFDVASSRAQNEGLLLARSWPCFEYWLLLHFTYVRSPFQRTHGRSPCDSCITTLRHHITDYEKNAKGLFNRLLTKVGSAIDRAKRASKDAQGTGSNDPSTEVHLLVEYLQNLQNQ